MLVVPANSKLKGQANMLTYYQIERSENKIDYEPIKGWWLNTEKKAIEVLHELRKNFPKTSYRIVKVMHQVLDA